MITQLLVFFFILFLNNIVSQQELTNVTYSLLIAARNDQYCGNSPERLAAALRSITEQLNRYSELHLRYEIIVCDWNSEIPLTKSAYVNSVITNAMNFIIVPPSTVQANKIVGAMSEVHAINTAIRRASGEFILRLDQDTIIGPNFTYFLVQALANSSMLLGDDIIWWSSRRESEREDYEAIIRNPVQAIVNKGRDNFQIYDFGKLTSVLDGVGAVGVLGMSKRLWTSVEAYDERLTGYGHMELELLQQPEMKKKIYNLPLEYDFYHIWHDQQCKYTGKPWNNHSFVARLPQPQWGLEGVDLERVRGTKSFAESDAIFRRIRQELSALKLEEAAILHEDSANNWKRKRNSGSQQQQVSYLWVRIPSPSQFPFGCRFKVNKFLGSVTKSLKAFYLSTLALQLISEEFVCPDVAPGTAVRINKSKQIYLFTGGSLRLFSSGSAFLKHGGNFSAVVDCPLHPGILKIVNMGANMH